MFSPPSVVFNRHFETNVLSSQYNKYEDARTCKTIICYDGNSLYLSCAKQEMSTGGEYYNEFIELFDLKLIHSVSKQFENDVLFGFRLGDIKLLEDRLGKSSKFLILYTKYEVFH